MAEQKNKRQSLNNTDFKELIFSGVHTVALLIYNEQGIDRILTMDIKKLIEETLNALSNNQSLSEVSSKIKIIVRLLGNNELKSWYNCEFVTGYTDKELPEYRKSKAADIRADYLVPHGFGVMQLTGQSVPMANLGPERYNDIMSIEFRDTISSIIEYNKHVDSISMSLTPYELAMVQKVLGNAQIQNARKLISPSSLQTIIDNVQNRIIDLFMDLDETFFNGELDITSTSTKERMHQVIIQNLNAGIVLTGNGSIDASNTNIAANVTNPLSSDVIAKISSFIDEIDKIVKDNDKEHDEIAQEIVDIRTELAKPNPQKNFLKKSFKAIAWGASVSIKAAIEEVVASAVKLLY